MITVEIFDDGSGLVTWAYEPTGEVSHTELSPDRVQDFLDAVCPNHPNGCGMCLACAVKAGWKEWEINKALKLPRRKS